MKPAVSAAGFALSDAALLADRATRTRLRCQKRCNGRGLAPPSGVQRNTSQSRRTSDHSNGKSLRASLAAASWIARATAGAL